MYFKYNGRDSKQWAYDLKCSLIIENLNSIEGEVLKTTNKYVEKAVRIKKINKNTGEITHFSKLEIDVINRWLFEEDYRCLEIGLYSYNAVFKRRRLIWSDNGFIDLVVRLAPNALSNKLINNVTVINDTITVTDIIYKENEDGDIIGEEEITYDCYRGEKVISLKVNGSKLDTELGIVLKGQDTTEVIIENITTSKTTIFKALKSFDNIYVCSKNNYIKSNDPNIYSKVNGIHLNLIDGVNEIKIKSDGFATVSIRYQEEFNLEEVWLNE